MSQLLMVSFISLTGCRAVMTKDAYLPFLRLEARSVSLSATPSTSEVTQPTKVFWDPNVNTNGLAVKWSQQPSTAEAFRLSETELQTLKRATSSGDAMAAYRIASFYCFTAENWTLYMRWCAVAAMMNGPPEAAQSLDVLHKSGVHQAAMKEAFNLTGREARTLVKEAEHNRNPRAAFRLALYHGYALGNPVQRNYWIRIGAGLGDEGCKSCLKTWEVFDDIVPGSVTTGTVSSSSPPSPEKR